MGSTEPVSTRWPTGCGSRGTSGSTSTSRLVGGDRGLLVVDTHASARAARAVIEEVRRLGAGEVVGVVNTHEHFDHTFGNGAFRTAYGAIPIHAHEAAAAMTVSVGRADQGPVRRGARRPARRRGPRDRDRAGRPHVLVGGRARPRRPRRRAGAPRARPHRRRPGGPGPRRRRGAGRRPGRGVGRARPRARLRRGLLPARVAAQPGHRARPADRRRPWSSPATARRSTASSSRCSATTSASWPRRSATWPPAAYPSTQALDAADWPYDKAHLAERRRRGYEQLPRGQRQLPLV